MLFTKKGAMFGLESRALKKQFGELFLARMQSVTPKEAHGARIQTKRGAMFGLDARIALAIFGALSVISGAALYSAIENSKVTALATELKETVKAYEAYVLDTGQDINAGSYAGDNPALMLIEDNSVEGWNGPYISYEQSTDYAPGLSHPDYDYFYFTKADKEDWPATGLPHPDNTCDGTVKCHVWLALRLGPNSSANVKMAEKLDLYFDGTDSINTGNFRYDKTSNAHVYIRLYAMPTISN
jgi:hypothetical protein